MANLKPTDLQRLDKLLGFNGGHVLDFTNSTFDQFIRSTVGLEVYSDKYAKYGDSKGKRLRALLEVGSDVVVGKLIIEFVDYWQTMNELAETAISETDKKLAKSCENIGYRLAGKEPPKEKVSDSEEEFLKQEFGEIDFDKLNLDAALVTILNERIEEIRNGLKANSSLSVIFLCGSCLEGVLLGVASQNAKVFNQAKSSPKDSNGKPKSFHLWTLSDLINAGCETGYLGLDVKKFSHELRDFRNYIHPHEQWLSKFSPDHNTAKISWQVFKAAMDHIGSKINGK